MNTPPAKAWVLAWKTDVISRFEMVNRESAPVGLKIFARNAAQPTISPAHNPRTSVDLPVDQYIDLGVEATIASGAPSETTLPTSTSQFAGTLCTRYPIATLQSTPAIGAGRK